MPSSSDKNARQSSATKSFFRNRLGRDKTDGRHDSSAGLDPSSAAMNGSWGSRHNQRESVASLDTGADGESVGLNMTAGVITSIPYSTTSETQAPVVMDYLPRDDQIPRREPQPHQLARGTDYHQYPAINTSPGSGNHTTHPTGPRPPPHNPMLTMASSQGGDRGTKLQQWGGGRPGSNTTNHNANDSYSTTDSWNGRRKSSDQASIKSNASSATRGSSLFSSENSSRTAVPSRDGDSQSILSPASSRLSKFTSHVSSHGWPAQQASAFNSTTSFAPAGFNLPRPKNDAEIESMFIELMHKRGWQNLPEQARRQMLAYAPAKKWTLVHQDKLTEWQGEQKRRNNIAIDGPRSRPDEEGSPEWYVKKIVDDTISQKQLQSLAVSLRTQPIGWVKQFIEAQGQIALTNVLMKLNRRQANGPTPAHSTASSDKDLDKEYDIVKCLKAIMNNKYGADDALSHQQVPIALALCLISPRLTTRSTLR